MRVREFIKKLEKENQDLEIYRGQWSTELATIEYGNIEWCRPICVKRSKYGTYVEADVDATPEKRVLIIE